MLAYPGYTPQPIFFPKCGWLLKNAAQFAAGHIFFGK